MMATEWHGPALFGRAAEVMVLPVVALLCLNVGWTRRIFVGVALALAGIAAATRDDWLAMVATALHTAAFIAAFFTALASLRNASASSASIQTCGRFLSDQPPGRRYAALTMGGHLFGMLLNYGALVLLGTLAEANAARERDAEIRGHRIRRMLLAIQRGFVSTLSWSPLAFAMAISTKLVPGASWAAAVGPCLVSAAILAGTGWALDTIFKPRLSHPPPPRTRPEGSWASLWPLLALLAVIAVTVGSLHLATGIRATGVVMVVVPLLSLGWVVIQNLDHRPFATAARRALDYSRRDLPAYRGELVLLLMAGFIGTLGSQLVAPLVSEAGVNLDAVAGWQILVALVWLIPLTGQLGMNPILSVSLVAPILPPAAQMGLTPADVIVAITAGWALSGASSPYTATTLLIGALGKVSARTVGLRWNGGYTLVCGVLLSIWVGLQAVL
ncbi:hypothetical protein H0I76_09490 [Limibaculum sp. M0105]|uniref:H+/citrate symporter n=2 Tax=Thermohalobaculum xanthum TaxID=2753746 RepID=A0A8J7M845_9RHOB|nr:hypothetical protein [Thermohalobaculum xanthum]